MTRFHQAKTVRLYNASSAALSYLQVPPFQICTEFAGAAQASAPIGGIGGKIRKKLTLPNKVQDWGELEAWEESNGDKVDEPVAKTLHSLPITGSMRLVIFTRSPERTSFTCLKVINSCERGTDVILLDGLHKVDPMFDPKPIVDGNVVSSLLELLKDVV